MVGRNSSGVPTSSQNLGTAAVPWGVIRANSMVLNGSAVDTSQIVSPVNRVVSGKMRSTSNQPAFITPNGAAASFILAAGTTSLLVDINGTPITISTNITKSSLTLAPSSQNTCLVDDADAADQADCKLWGEPEHRKTIKVDAAGSNITNLIGKFAAFKVAGVADEYFVALVKSATELTDAKRGYFYDSSLNPINRTGFSNNDTITLMSLGWVFVDQDTTTVDVSYKNPSWSFVAPTSPATGDYWYDLANSTWKRYDGASWSIINRTYVGQVIIDTANCVGARCVDFYANYGDQNSMSLEVSTTEIVISSKPNAKVNVAGNLLNFFNSRPSWNITTDLAGSADMYNATEQSSTLYYPYIKDTGALVMSDISPYYRDDLLGQYHPHNPWRCVGGAYNDGSSNIINAGGVEKNIRSEVHHREKNGLGATSTVIRRMATQKTNLGTDIIYVDDSNLGGLYNIKSPGKYFMTTVDNSSGQPRSYQGFTLNTTQLTTAIQSLSNPDEQLILGTTSNADNSSMEVSVIADLKIGDVVRVHGNVDLNDTVNCPTKVMRIS